MDGVTEQIADDANRRVLALVSASVPSCQSSFTDASRATHLSSSLPLPAFGISPGVLSAPRALGWKNLPETAKRVETHLTHRKQSTGYRATRDTPRDTNVHRISGSAARRAAPVICAYPLNIGVVSTAHQLPLTTHWPLIGTPERLETCLSRGKQSIGDHSNRYTSHHNVLPGKFATRAPARSCRGRHARSTALYSQPGGACIGLALHESMGASRESRALRCYNRLSGWALAPGRYPFSGKVWA